MITERFGILEIMLATKGEAVYPYASAYKEARLSSETLTNRGYLLREDAILEAGIMEHSFNKLTRQRLRHTFKENDTPLTQQSSVVEFIFDNKQEQTMFLLRWA